MAAKVIKICGVDVRVLDSCPPDTAQFLAFNVPGEVSGAALYSWATMKCCAIAGVFGAGILKLTGSQFDVDGQYFNDSLINDLLVFYNGTEQFIDDPTDWDYILNVAQTKVIGIKIKIGFNIDDQFVVFPNPNCGSNVPDPAPDFVAKPTLIPFDNITQYLLLWGSAFILKYGLAPNIDVYIYDPMGNLVRNSTVPVVADDRANPTQFLIDMGGTASGVIIIGG